MTLVDVDAVIDAVIQILHDDVTAPNGHLDPYYVFKAIKSVPDATAEEARRYYEERCVTDRG